MTVAKCSKCLKDIDDAANFCKHCGAQALSTGSGDNQAQTDMSESQMNLEKFQSALTSTIDIRFAEIMTSKKDTEAYLTYIDAQILTTKVRGIFKNALNVIPPQVEKACLSSEKLLAPSTKEKENRIKAALGITGGVAGIGVVIAAVVSANNWWGSVFSRFSDNILGATHYGAIACGVAGLLLAAVAGYFATRNNHQIDTERFLLNLKSSTAKAVDAIWAQYNTELSHAVTEVSSTRG